MVRMQYSNIAHVIGDMRFALLIAGIVLYGHVSFAGDPIRPPVAAAASNGIDAAGQQTEHLLTALRETYRSRRQGTGQDAFRMDYRFGNSSYDNSRTEVMALDPVVDSSLEDQVLLTEAEKIGAVRSFGRGSEPEKEFRLEVIDEATVGARRGVVELVDDDVVEVLRPEPRKMINPTQRLDGRE